MGGVSQTAIKAAIFGTAAAVVLFLIMWFVEITFIAQIIRWALPIGVGFLAVNWKKTTDLVANAIEGATAGGIYAVLYQVVFLILLLILTGFLGFDVVDFLISILITAALAAVGGVLAGMMG